MSNDPAVEAAQRVCGHRTRSTQLAAEAGAREALKPIRELHRPVPASNVGFGLVCDHDRLFWPCATARLIYPESELR